MVRIRFMIRVTVRLGVMVMVGVRVSPRSGLRVNPSPHAGRHHAARVNTCLYRNIVSRATTKGRAHVCVDASSTRELEQLRSTGRVVIFSGAHVG